MSFAARQRVFIAAAALACIATASIATEAQPIAPSAYRLDLANVSLFRLTSLKGHLPPSVESPEAARASRLAELPFAAQVESAARNTALDPALVHALIHVESRHNPVARSPKGALGLMQVMPETASRYGVTNAVHSVEANLKAGTSYLRNLMDLFDGRIELVLAAYNAGENAILRHGRRIPPYRETQQYVPAVLEKYREWRETPSVEPQVPRRTIYLPGTQLESRIPSQN